jgi:hypothetical protein
MNLSNYLKPHYSQNFYNMNMNESHDQSTIVGSTGYGCTEFVHEHLGTVQYCANAQKNEKLKSKPEKIYGTTSNHKLYMVL